MSADAERGGAAACILWWVARLTALAAIVPLMMILVGERGDQPIGIRTWIYLALFPFGFSAGYLAGWRWPLAGGCFSIACLAASLLVIGRTVGWQAYPYWGALSMPGVLFIITGWKLRRAAVVVLAIACWAGGAAATCG
jgi:hypothetical protein